jgi:copper chaperone CopZ
MGVVTETIQVSGIRCERCVMRLAKVLEGHDGLEAANANLMGHVTVTWDDERTSRAALLEAMSRGGFRLLEPLKDGVSSLPE